MKIIIAPIATFIILFALYAVAAAQTSTDVMVVLRCGEKHSWTDANGNETVTQDGPYDCCAAAKSAAYAFAHQRQRLTTDQQIALGKMTQYMKANSCPP